MDTKIREEFEAAYVEEMVRRCGEGYRSSVLYSLSLKGQDGDYLHVTAAQAFWAWKASRAALVIELPYADQEFEYRHGGTTYFDGPEYRDAVFKAVESHGIKVVSP